jgi:CTP:molybdopterin cytidylyltransferase MocA
MGASKLTLPWKSGGTIIEAVVALLRQGGVDRILVVVGGERQAIEAVLAKSGVELVENPDFAEGEMLSSIQVGLRALDDASPAALVTPGDLPGIQPSTVRFVVEAWTASGQAVCAPVHGGRRGHPVLLPRRVWPDVLGLRPGQSLRAYLREHRDEILHVEVEDAGIHADVDTPEDYRSVR